MNIIKKLLIICATMVVFAAFGACKQEQTQQVGKVPERPVQELTLSESAYEIVLGEEVQIKALYTVVAGLKLEYTSSNPEIVTINETGVMQALKTGSATITVTYGEQSKQCDVNVVLGNKMPELVLKELSSDTLNLTCGDSLNLDSYIAFNGKTYNDMQVAYKYIGDADLGVIDEETKIFTTSTAEYGECKIEISAVWSGISGENVSTMKKVLSISVKPLVFIQTNLNEYNLYTVDSFLGESYATSLPFEIDVYENGEKQDDYEMEIVEGAEVISIKDGKINALAHGTAEIEVRYTDIANTLQIKKLFIEVKRPIKTYTEPIDFSSVDGTLPLTDLFGKNVSLVEAYQKDNEKPLTISADGQKISGLIMNKRSVTESELTIYSNDAGVIIPIRGYAKLIKTQEDLKVFDIVDNDDDRSTANPLIIDGYYALANDIKNTSGDDSNKHYGMVHAAATTTNGNIKYLQDTDAAYVEQGFKGTFDGQGYTMEVDIFSGGIFGALLLGAEIKDVSIDATFVNNASVYVGVLAHSMPQTSTNDGTFTPSDDRIFLHNTYVHISDLRTNLDSSRTAGLVAFAHRRGLVMQDVLVEIDKHSLVDGTTTASGALFGSCSFRNIMGGRAAKNVYVISSGAIFMSMNNSPTGTAATQNHKAVSINDVTVGEDGTYTLNDAFKDYSFADVAVYDDSTTRNGGFYLFKNVYRYGSKSALMETTALIGNWSITADKISWAE